MPPKRRSTGGAAKSSQSTLAFHGASNKVTKPGASLRTSKKDLLSSTPSKLIQSDPTEDGSPTTAEAAIIEQAQQEVAAQEVTSAPEDERARTLTEAKIKQYWQKKEKERKAPRVHQQGLSLHEKVLREWDTSGQYGV